MSEEQIENKIVLSKEDFKSDQMVKWCPGCGDHAILSSMEKVFPQLGIPKENFVVVSGIGCSSRFPYYMNTYGIHGIHGRAAAIATGVKLANPKLSVWMITGDGDCLAIGGNHFIHAVRRNIGINIILFNNKIYGLTKGQFSPTTPMGKKTKTSPQGTFEHPFNPGELAIGAQGTFFARGIDNNPKMMVDILFEAQKHQGATVVEILQNCVIFNHKTHDLISSRETKHDNQILLEHGKKMIFGKEKDKGIVLRGNRLEVVKIGVDGVTEDEVLTHDAHTNDPGIQVMLAKMAPPKFPMAMGVIRSVRHNTFDENMERIVAETKASANIKNVDDLLQSGNTWEI